MNKINNNNNKLKQKTFKKNHGVCFVLDNQSKELKKIGFLFASKYQLHSFLASGGTGRMFIPLPQCWYHVWFEAVQVPHAFIVFVSSYVYRICCVKKTVSLESVITFGFYILRASSLISSLSLQGSVNPSFLRLLLSCVLVPAIRKLINVINMPSPHRLLCLTPCLSLSWQCQMGSFGTLVSGTWLVEVDTTRDGP